MSLPVQTTLAQFVSVLTLILTLTRAQKITECTYDAAICGCRTPNGVISLKKFTNAPFKGPDPDKAVTYYWSPCKDISKGGYSASCLQEYSTTEYYDCGVHSKMSAGVQDGEVVFKMDAGDDQRHSMTICQCQKKAKDTFTVIGEDGATPGLYDFKLTGDSCCPKSSAGGAAGSSGGLSVGSILLIVVLVVVIVYLVAGAVVQTAVRKAEGKERIPNVGFWALVPGLIKDGFRFTFSCGKSKQYDQI